MMTVASQRIAVRYDEAGDVLYVAKGRPVPASSDSGPRGVLFRFSDADDSPCGVTVVGFVLSGWDRDIDELSSLIAQHVGVDAQYVQDAVRSATASVH